MELQKDNATTEQHAKEKDLEEDEEKQVVEELQLKEVTSGDVEDKSSKCMDFNCAAVLFSKGSDIAGVAQSVENNGDEPNTLACKEEGQEQGKDQEKKEEVEVEKPENEKTEDERQEERKESTEQTGGIINNDEETVNSSTVMSNSYPECHAFDFTSRLFPKNDNTKQKQQQPQDVINEESMKTANKSLLITTDRIEERLDVRSPTKELRDDFDDIRVNPPPEGREEGEMTVPKKSGVEVRLGTVEDVLVAAREVMDEVGNEVTNEVRNEVGDMDIKKRNMARQPSPERRRFDLPVMLKAKEQEEDELEQERNKMKDEKARTADDWIDYLAKKKKDQKANGTIAKALAKAIHLPDKHSNSSDSKVLATTQPKTLSNLSAGNATIFPGTATSATKQSILKIQKDMDPLLDPNSMSTTVVYEEKWNFEHQTQQQKLSTRNMNSMLEMLIKQGWTPPTQASTSWKEETRFNRSFRASNLPSDLDTQNILRQFIKSKTEADLARNYINEDNGRSTNLIDKMMDDDVTTNSERMSILSGEEKEGENDIKEEELKIVRAEKEEEEERNQEQDEREQQEEEELGAPSEGLEMDEKEKQEEDQMFINLNFENIEPIPMMTSSASTSCDESDSDHERRLLLQRSLSDDIPQDLEERRSKATEKIRRRVIDGWVMIDATCPFCTMPLVVDGVQEGSVGDLEVGLEREFCVLCGDVSPIMAALKDGNGSVGSTDRAAIEIKKSFGTRLIIGGGELGSVIEENDQNREQDEQEQGELDMYPEEDLEEDEEVVAMTAKEIEDIYGNIERMRTRTPTENGSVSRSYVVSPPTIVRKTTAQSEGTLKAKNNKEAHHELLGEEKDHANGDINPTNGPINGPTNRPNEEGSSRSVKKEVEKETISTPVKSPPDIVRRFPAPQDSCDVSTLGVSFGEDDDTVDSRSSIDVDDPSIVDVQLKMMGINNPKRSFSRPPSTGDMMPSNSSTNSNPKSKKGPILLKRMNETRRTEGKDTILLKGEDAKDTIMIKKTSNVNTSFEKVLIVEQRDSPTVTSTATATTTTSSTDSSIPSQLPPRVRHPSRIPPSPDVDFIPNGRSDPHRTGRRENVLAPKTPVRKLSNTKRIAPPLPRRRIIYHDTIPPRSPASRLNATNSKTRVMRVRGPPAPDMGRRYSRIRAQLQHAEMDPAKEKDEEISSTPNVTEEEEQVSE